MAWAHHFGHGRGAPLGLLLDDVLQRRAGLLLRGELIAQARSAGLRGTVPVRGG